MIYAGLLFVVLSSVYTFSFAAYAWKENNKRASIGVLLITFMAMGVTLIAFLRT